MIVAFFGYLHLYFCESYCEKIIRFYIVWFCGRFSNCTKCETETHYHKI